MEAKLLPRPMGCIWLPLQILTLGVLTLLLRSAEGKFVRRMDDEGLETRGGKRIVWSEIRSTQPIRYVMGPARVAEEIIFSSPRGRASIHSRRHADYQALAEYALARVPSESIVKRR